MSQRPRTIRLPQGVVQYSDIGQGQPVLFIHGVLVDSELWQPVVRHLQPASSPHHEPTKGLRLIVPDWPLGAHTISMNADAGLSVPGMVQLIADFITTLDLRDVIVVGNDSGGALTQMLCADFPERIAGMVLTTCDAYDVFPPKAFAILKLAGMVPPLAWLSYWLMRHMKWTRRLPFTFGALTEQPLPESLIERWIAPAYENPAIRRDACKLLRSVSTRYTLAAAERLKHVDKPALLLWSKRCRFFPPRLATQLQTDLPRAQLHWVDSTSTFVPLDHGAWVGEHIRRFAASLATQSAPVRQERYANGLTAGQLPGMRPA
jgi:pimeloyl-ACP methyl ester carboxylesterase